MKTMIYILFPAALVAGCSAVPATDNFETHGDLEGNRIYRQAYNTAAEGCEKYGKSFDRCVDEQHGCFIEFACELNSLSKKYGQAEVDRKLDQSTAARA